MGNWIIYAEHFDGVNEVYFHKILPPLPAQRDFDNKYLNYPMLKAH